jgi:uncharacterized protein (DUF2141 family)
MRVQLGLLVLILCVNSAQAKWQDTESRAELTIYARSNDGPVAGAVIVVRASGKQRLSITGPGGVCKFTRLSPGSYSIQVTIRPFFVAPEDEEQLNGLQLAAGDRQSLALRLTKGGVLSGRLLSLAGLPIIGMPVTALAVKSESGKTVLPSPKESNVTALSDDRGEFRIYGLRPDRYALAVNASHDSYQLRSIKTIYYPGQSEVLSATTFPIEPGQEIALPDMLMDLKANTANSLSTRIVGMKGTPVAGVSLSLQKVDGGYLYDSGVTDRRGQLSFEGLSAGKYLLKAAANRESYFANEKEIAVNDFVSNDVILQLTAYPAITGSAYLRDKRGTNPMPALEIGLITRKVADSLTFTSNSMGAFSVTSPDPGPFWWRFPNLSRTNYLEKIELNGKDVTYQALQLDHRLDLNGIVLRFATGPATIKGRVGLPDGATCAGNVVYAVGLNNAGEPLFVKPADECSGTLFSIFSLPPGRYFVVTIRAEGTENGSIHGPIGRFGINESHYWAIMTMAKDLDKTNPQPLKLEAGRSYSDVLPVKIKAAGQQSKLQ